MGESVTTRAPLVRNRRNGGYTLDEPVRIRYDRSDPTQVVIDESRLARDITMWIVAVKLLVCGAILVGFGLRTRRRTPLAPTVSGERAVVPA